MIFAQLFFVEKEGQRMDCDQRYRREEGLNLLGSEEERECFTKW